MGSGTPMLDRVMSQFKAPHNGGLYVVYGGLNRAQGLVDQLTQGELKGFGVTEYIEVKPERRSSTVVSIGQFGEGVQTDALFHRVNELFRGQRLPLLLEHTGGVQWAVPDSYARSVLSVFGAMKAAGAELRSALFPGAVGDSLKIKDVGANFERDGVRLNVDMTFRSSEYVEDPRLLTITLSAAFLRGDDTDVLEGYQILRQRLREILSPLVTGDGPFLVLSTTEPPPFYHLYVGVRGDASEGMIQATSDELGINMDGTIALPRGLGQSPA